MAEDAELRWTPSVRIVDESDVIVVGGGIAGVCAACAAADMNQKVVLIERFATLGGNGTNGGVSGFCGETKGQGKIFDEIIADLEKFKAIKKYFPAHSVFMRGRGYDQEILALILQEIVLRRNITLLLHTRFVGVQKEKNTITHVIIYGKSGLEAIPCKYVVDCSGEAEVVHNAGFETMKGRESDGLQLPMSLIFFIRTKFPWNFRKKIPKQYFPWEPFRRRGDLPMISFSGNGYHSKGVKIKIPSYDSTETIELTNAEIQGRRKMMQVIEYYTSKQKRNWEYESCSPQIGIREGRRGLGKYVLTVEDVRAGREFNDAIAVGCFPLDAHDPADDKRTYILNKKELHVPPYQIPLRSLLAFNCPNLLMAGRTISADQLALSSARVMTTCAMTGQAAGTAIGLVLRENIDFETLLNEQIGKLQNILKNGGTALDLGAYSKN